MDPTLAQDLIAEVGRIEALRWLANECRSCTSWRGLRAGLRLMWAVVVA